MNPNEKPDKPNRPTPAPGRKRRGKPPEDKGGPTKPEVPSSVGDYTRELQLEYEAEQEKGKL